MCGTGRDEGLLSGFLEVLVRRLLLDSGAGDLTGLAADALLPLILAHPQAYQQIGVPLPLACFTIYIHMDISVKQQTQPYVPLYMYLYRCTHIYLYIYMCTCICILFDTDTFCIQMHMVLRGAVQGVCFFACSECSVMCLLKLYEHSYGSSNCPERI